MSANSTTAGTTLTINGAANTGGVTVSATNSTIVANITGSATASNVLTGTGGADTIVGGSAADTIQGGVGADILTGGAGADTFRVTSQVASFTGGAPSSTVFETITDYALSSDIVDDTTAAFTLSLDAGTSASAGVAGISATGIATFNIADSTLALRIAAVNAGLNSGSEATGQIAAFEFGSDSYVFINNAVSNAVTALDGLIKLSGVTGLTSLNIGNGNLTVAGSGGGGSFALSVIGAENITGTAGDDTITGTYINADGATFNTTDVISGAGGFDTLSISSNTVAITPPDTLWANVTGIEKIVFTTTGAGAQTITTGANFDTNFTAAGVELAARNASGDITIDMATTPFTGTATLTAVSTGAAAHTITTGSGVATVASVTTAGAQVINGAGLTTVTATSNGAGVQTIGAVSSGNLVTVTAIQNGAGSQNITSTSTDDVTVTATQSTSATGGDQNITTGDGDDIVTVTTNIANTNVITTGAGSDTILLLATGVAATLNTITAGLGADGITLVTGAFAARDDIVITGGLTADSITNFTTGAGGDKIQLSLSDLETAGAVEAGVTITLDDLDDGTTAIGVGAANIQEVADQNGGAVVLAAGARNVYVLLTETYLNAAAMETGLETGDHELQAAGGATIVNDSFMVVWSDGTNAYLSNVRITVDTTDFATGDLVATNLVTLVGNPSITAGEFNADNFAFIA